jgi:uncharacterized protein YkwD
MLRRSVLLVTLIVAVIAIGAGCAPRRTAAPASSGGSNWQHVMMAEVNEWRRANGLGPLAWCGTLSHAAQGQSGYQAAIGAMTHDGGGGLGQRANSAGYVGWNSLGENVAYGYSDAVAVVHGWLNSPGHRANLLSPTYQHIGLGLAHGGGTPYWTQDFGRGGSC